MENPSPDSIPPELQVWVDTEMSLEGSGSPAEHQKIQSLLGCLPGVGSLSFVGDRVAIRYDPEKVTGARLCELMSQAGFKVSEMHSASSDPVDDIHENDRASGGASS